MASLAGAPKKERGHHRKNVSFNRETLNFVDSLRRKGINYSEWIEEAIALKRYVEEKDALEIVQISVEVSKYGIEDKLEEVFEPIRELLKMAEQICRNSEFLWPENPEPTERPWYESQERD